MTQDALTKEVGKLVDGVISDPRWKKENDDLGVSILGMIIYGYAMMVGRTVMFLDMEDIDGAVLRCLTERVKVATKWGTGLVGEARASAIDKNHHIGQAELIGVGHSYFGVEDRAAIIDNVFQNIASFRKRVK